MCERKVLLELLYLRKRICAHILRNKHQIAVLFYVVLLHDGIKDVTTFVLRQIECLVKCGV